jgi:hypothetical protein
MTKKPITVAGRTLTLSEKSHPGLTYTITEVDNPAFKTNGNGNSVLVNQIKLSCQCSGDYVAGTSTFDGSGTASIVADTHRIKCENESILLEGDNVKIECEGTITYTTGSPPPPPEDGSASIKVTITNTNQSNIFVCQS